LYDVNPRVFGVWDYLIKVSYKELISLPTEFDRVDDLTHLPQEARWFMGFWVKAGQSEPGMKPGPWMLTQRSRSALWSAATRRRVAEQLEHIRHWKVYNSCYDECPNVGATWFIDPPYQRSGTYYTFNDINYTYLGHWAARRKGQTICCGQDGDNWVPFRPFMVTEGLHVPGGPGKSKEVIWTNSMNGVAK
jgi:hypothetical protein